MLLMCGDGIKNENVPCHISCSNWIPLSKNFFCVYKGRKEYIEEIVRKFPVVSSSRASHNLTTYIKYMLGKNA